MQPLSTINHWMERVRDRERVGTFARFLARRFLDDRLFQAAAALAYTTIFALVPLAIVVFGVLSAFPQFGEWRDQLTEYIFSNFVPSAASTVKETLLQLADSATTLTVAGAIGLIVSLLITLNSVESTFNQIWRVPSSRPQLGRFLVYWTVLTLGSLLAAASLAMSAWLLALPVFSTREGQLLSGFALRAAPTLIELLLVTALYRVVPHRSVALRHAFAGALLAIVLLEMIKWGLGLYLGTFKTYQRLYGALAALPILMLWIYLCWVAILLGASFASAISAFRYQPAAMRLPEGYEIYGLLRLLGRFAEARCDGRGLHTEQMLELEPMLTDNQLKQFLAQLADIDLLKRAESGEWLLARDLDTLTLADLYEACQLRIPVTEAWLPCRDDALGAAAIAALDDLRLPLRDLLKRNVARLYPTTGETS
ncbi:MAG TPA: YihY family inner membrane protein [Luteimonas sp.]|nr:YihY family inner membrane protein [Luteimonas sp.]HRO27295.1 YihY family inner membrane protein [Luteimonas sp.]HRP73881.1 YihY family inner membrane protein [Luteimonas sp.]